ncbi:MAG: VanW family protein [Thermoleophilia bacterium]|nr:VanW family protein [Thermoleophilia bacterium]
MTVRRLLFGVLLLLVAAAAGLLSYDLLASHGKVHPGVRSWGVDLGGLEPAAAREALEVAAARALVRPLRVSAADVAVSLIPSSAGVTLDAAETVRRAEAAADGGQWWDDATRRVRLWWSGDAVQPALVVSDRAAWDRAADEVALAFEQLPRDARLILTDDGPKVVAGDDGAVVDRKALEAAVLAAVAGSSAGLDAPVGSVAPRATTEQAAQSMGAARQAFSADVELAYQGSSYRVTSADLVHMAAVDPDGVSAGHPLTFDTPQARALLEQRLASVEHPPVDAVIRPTDDRKGFTVVPSSDGTLVEWDGLLAALGRAAMSRDQRYVPIPTRPAHPKLTTLDAEQLGLRREIASFTTYFSAGNAARVNNIRQVASILDGTIVRPGETFSFNQSVGPRTKAAGFDEAPVIRDGVLTPGVGGGICQVSTTLFNAAFFAGLPVVERRPHSFFIDHYPVGRDATVSYGAVDLKFRNDSDNVLLVSVTATDRSVRVSLAAPRWDRKVTYSTAPFHDVVPPSSSEQKPRRLRDPALAAGQTSAVEAGVAGRNVEVTRTVTRADGTRLFTDTFQSVYAPTDYVVRVGG